MRKLIALSLVALFLGCAHSVPVKTHEKSKFFGTSEVHRYELQNGLKVLILEDDSSPTFAYYTWYNVGARDEEPGLTGLAHLFEHMMFKKTKTQKADGEFDRKLESAGAEGLNAFTSKDYTTYVQSLPKDKLELIVSLEADRMVNLLVNDDVLNKEREVVKNERKFRTDNNPDGQLYERIYEIAYKKHSYRWPVIGYEQDLNNAKQSQCENFYKRYYAPNNATVVIVGDVSPSSALNLVNKYYGKIPRAEIGRHISKKEPKQTSQRIETKYVKSTVQKLVAAYHVPEVNHQDIPGLLVLRNILAGGKSSRLYRRLVDGGIATAADVVDDTEKKDPGLFILFVNMQKGKTGRQALSILDQEIRKIKKGKITEDEMRTAVSMYRFALFDYLAANKSKAYFLGFYETVAGNFGRGFDIVNAMKRVTKKDLVRIAKTYFKSSNRSIIFGKPNKALASAEKKQVPQGAPKGGSR